MSPQQTKIKSILLLGGCGYIGSRLFPYLQQQDFVVSSVDIEWFGNPACLTNNKINFKKLSKKFIQNFDAVILLAAHSSVKSAARKPSEAITNNINLFEALLSKLAARQVLIYASSASVYHGAGNNLVDESSTQYHPLSYYDISKYASDALAPLACKAGRYYGLRFGTVCGSSPNFRSDLLLNSMALRAFQSREIHVSNATIRRPVLGISDLCRAINQLLLHPSTPSGIYNLASFNTTVGAAAEKLAALTNSKIIYGPDTPAYDFAISCQKFSQALNFKFNETVESISENILQDLRTGKIATWGAR